MCCVCGVWQWNRVHLRALPPLLSLMDHLHHQHQQQHQQHLATGVLPTNAPTRHPAGDLTHPLHPLSQHRCNNISSSRPMTGEWSCPWRRDASIPPSVRVMDLSIIHTSSHSTMSIHPSSSHSHLEPITITHTRVIEVGWIECVWM